MNRKIYRICLMTAIVIAIFSGILYYEFYQKQEVIPKEGTFVWQETMGSEYA